MADTVTLELVCKHVLETRDAVPMLAGIPDVLRHLQDDQTVIIRMLQARDAELDLIRSLEQQYAGLRARLAEFERRSQKLETSQLHESANLLR